MPQVLEEFSAKLALHNEIGATVVGFAAEVHAGSAKREIKKEVRKEILKHLTDLKKINHNPASALLAKVSSKTRKTAKA